MREEIVVGVDSGGTKTIALVADSTGHVLAAARGGSGLSSASQLNKAMATVASTVENALIQAGLRGADVALAICGLSGADWPEDYEPRAALLRGHGIAKRVVVKNDSFLGLRAGTSRPFGIVIIAGTGVNAAVITPDGQEWAFGYYVTYGGGKDMAYEAIQAILRHADGRGSATAITDMALDRLGFSAVEEMLRALVARKVKRQSLMALGPLVFQAAYTGDPVATAIIVKQGEALAEYGATLIKRFDMQALEFDVVLSGGVFRGIGPLLVDTVTRDIHRVAPQAHIVRPRLEPAAGGLLLAYDALGIPVTEVMYDNLALTSPPEAFFNTAGNDQTITHEEDDSADEDSYFRRRKYLHP